MKTRDTNKTHSIEKPSLADVIQTHDRELDEADLDGVAGGRPGPVSKEFTEDGKDCCW